MDRHPPSEQDRRPGTGPLPGPATADWPRKAVNAIDRVVDTVHDKAVRPLALVARAVVFGLLVVAIGTVLLVLLSIGFMRVLNVYAFEHRNWISYLVVGAVFSVVGLFAWAKRFSREDGEAERI